MKNYLIYFLLVVLIFVRYFGTRPEYKGADSVKITTQVLTDPKRYTTSQYVRLKGLKIYLPVYPDVHYGDRVVIEGIIDGDRLKNPQLISVAPTKNLLYLLRQRLVDFYTSTLPEPHGSLIAGMVLGSRQSLPEDFSEALKITGTAHVVVASGMNVALVGGFLTNGLLTVLQRKKAVIGAVVGIWIYACISGLDAPIVRAAIMASIAFLAQLTGRLNHTFKALILTGLVMLVINPNWLADIGFVLSFTATASLMAFESKVDRLIYFVPKIIRKDLSTTLAAQIGVAPLLYFYFGQLNIFSPIINAFILWTVPLITIFGFLGGIIGLLIPGVGKLILFMCYPLTWYFTFIIDLFS